MVKFLKRLLYTPVSPSSLKPAPIRSSPPYPTGPLTFCLSKVTVAKSNDQFSVFILLDTFDHSLLLKALLLELHSLPSLLTSYALSDLLEYHWDQSMGLFSAVYLSYPLSCQYHLCADSSQISCLGLCLEHQHHPPICLLDSFLHHNSPEVFHASKVFPYLN